MFESVLLTGMGKYFVRQHEDDFDAQAIYKKLQEHAKTSTQATLDSSSLLTYLTSARLDTKWGGTAHAFILNWCDKLRTYEDMLPVRDHLSQTVKMNLLQNTVAGVDDLNQVKLRSAHDVAHGQRALDYEQYKTLLLSAATTYDAKRGLSRSRPARKVQEHALHDAAMEPEPDEASANEAFDTYNVNAHASRRFNIDTDILDLQAHAARSRPTATTNRAPRMSREQWYSLTPDEQALWDQFSDASKHVILGHPTKNPSGTVPAPAPPPRRVNLHDISAADYLQLLSVHQHFASPTSAESAEQDDFQDAVDSTDDLAPDPDQALLAMATKRAPAPAPKPTKPSQLTPGDIRPVLGSQPSNKQYKLKNHIIYSVSAHCSADFGSLADRGANGGLAGSDVRIISRSESPRQVDVSGIDNHQLTNLPIVSVGGVVQSQRGPVIAIMHQYAYTGQGKTIHSSAQLEHFRNQVHDKSLKVEGGLQCIQTVDGYVHLLTFRQGLPYIPIRPYTDEEWERLPHVVWTSDADWDPSVLDGEPPDEDVWYDTISDLSEGLLNSPFDEFGNYRHCTIGFHRVGDGEELSTHGTIQDIVDDASAYHTPHFALPEEDEHGHQLHCKLHSVQQRQPDYELLRPFFLHASADVVKRTFEATTQYAQSISAGNHMKKTFRLPFPALNVHCQREAVATDTVYSDTPALDNGSTAAQVFFGRDSLVGDAYGVKTDKQFVNTLQDNIRKRGAMDKLISDGAQAEVSKRVLDIFRAYNIDDWRSEPHHQHQNHAERRWGVTKPLVNLILKISCAPASAWLLALLYVLYILNQTATPSLGWRTPLEVLDGDTPDISAMLQFEFWEPVYYRDGSDGVSFPSGHPEKLGRFAGFAENVGHAMTYKVVTDDTNKIIHRSVIRSARTALQKSRGDQSGDIPEVLKSKYDRTGDPANPPMATIDVESLVGRTFLMPRQDDGQRYRAKIVEAIDDHQRGLHSDPVRVKFRCTVNDEEFEELITYNELMDSIAKDETEEGLWKFKSITAHQGPLLPSHPAYKGSKYNVLVNWETGESTFEPLATIAADDPITCAIYAKENNLLGLDGWKQFNRIANRQKKLIRAANQAKLKSFRTTLVYKFGYLVPRNHDQAVEIDRKNGNTRWQDAELTETSSLDEYDTFIDKGKDYTPPGGYKKIRCHMVYDVKHDGRHKARLVAGGHLTDTPVESVYSSVVSLKGLRLVMFLAELNGLDVWATDVGNAYLEANTKEKVYIIAGPEFGTRQGHVLLINKALYGLKSSGLRWHERFADSLREMGFVPSRAENDIWMRRAGDVYEYIATYVDDLAICSKDPQAIIDELTKVHKYKLKGTGPISYHLGCDYFRDDDGVLCFAPRKYIDKMIDGYVQMFGQKPKEASSPLEKGDHPELDLSPELDANGIRKYQSMIGSLQWAVSLGRMDITTAVMTMSSFRACPRVGHLERLKRMYGYLSKMKHATIRMRVSEPDYSDIPDAHYEWLHTVYGNVTELIPEDAPELLGKIVILTTYVDASLYHDMLTGQSVTGIIHLINQTSFD